MVKKIFSLCSEGNSQFKQPVERKLKMETLLCVCKLQIEKKKKKLN